MGRRKQIVVLRPQFQQKETRRNEPINPEPGKTKAEFWYIQESTLSFDQEKVYAFWILDRLLHMARRA